MGGLRCLERICENSLHAQVENKTCGIPAWQHRYASVFHRGVPERQDCDVVRRADIIWRDGCNVV